MKRLALLATALLLAATIAGCGGGDDPALTTGPGFVGVDDSASDTAPLLTVDFVDPLLGPGQALILSDPLSDGDIAFDPVQSLFTVTTNTTPLFFGVDFLDPNEPEFRAFLTFPLDGSTGQDVVPSAATITRATMELFITQVDFFDVIPTFLDLVPYGALGVEDYSAVPLDFRTLDFFFSDQGNFVLIDVTPLMVTAQAEALLDFQVRFSVIDGAAAPLAGPQVARPQGEAPKKADRSVSSVSSAPKRPARTPQAGGPTAPQGTPRPPRSR